MEHFFSPNSSGHLPSDAHQSQIIGGDADVDHTQTVGGIQSSYWGDISPPGFGTPGCNVRNLTNTTFFTIFNCAKIIFFCANNCGMIPWFS